MSCTLVSWIRSFYRGESVFSLNQKVVYPGHGVAQVSRIFEKKFGTQSTVFCELKFLSKDATIMVALDKAEEVGVRALSSSEHINDILGRLTVPPREISQAELSASNWNRRNKVYQNKLRGGSLKDISEIYCDLKCIAKQKELSFGEKNLLVRAEFLLVEEISAAEHVAEDKAMERLRSPFVPLMGAGAREQYGKV